MQSVEQYAIKTAVAVCLAEQVMLRCKNDTAPLCHGNARPGTTKVAAAAQADFNENQRLAITADEVDLATANPEIALDNP